MSKFRPVPRPGARSMPRGLPLPTASRLRRGLDSLSRLRPSSGVSVVAFSAGASIRMYQPPKILAPGPALLWIHGGGYVSGSAVHDDDLCRRLSAALGITVAALDYRSAPQRSFPTTLDDYCSAALDWLVDQPTVDPARVAIGGASTGGALAAALAVRVRDQGKIAPVLQLLSYPMLDHGTAPRGDADLSGLAPAWIGVGTFDLFHDQDTGYADRLAHAGVPCALDVLPGVFHGFDAIAPKTVAAQELFDRQCEALRRAFDNGAACAQRTGPMVVEHTTEVRGGE